MLRFKLLYEPDMLPRLEYQRRLHTLGKDLDRTELTRKTIEEAIDWTLTLCQKIYAGAEVLGPVTKKGGAIIFLGDTGEIIIRPVFK